jgi:hypothetical protein
MACLKRQRFRLQHGPSSQQGRLPNALPGCYLDTQRSHDAACGVLAPQRCHPVALLACHMLLPTAAAQCGAMGMGHPAFQVACCSITCQRAVVRLALLGSHPLLAARCCDVYLSVWLPVLCLPLRAGSSHSACTTSEGLCA